MAKILFVEDEAFLLQGFIQALEDRQHEILIARDGEEALNRFKQNDLNLDLIILDVMLPPGNIYIKRALGDDIKSSEMGLEILKQLRNIDKEIPVVVLTAVADDRIKEQISDLRVNSYLNKPVSLNTFLNSIDKALASTKKNELDVFVLMPFADQYREFYSDVIKKTLEDIKLVCKRADDFFLSTMIMSDIIQYIKKARFIIADFSGRSPNVFFEVGIAHALKKSVILLAQDLHDVPPRLQNARCHIYKSDLSGAKDLPLVLHNIVNEISKNKYPPFFKNYSYQRVPQQCVALIPSSERGEEVYKQLILPMMKQFKMNCFKADEIFDPNSVLDTIWAQINKSRLVIALLADRDPDIFYLAGLAYGLGKKVIYFAERKEDIPFDLKQGSSIIYSLQTYEGEKELGKLLLKF